ncbi:PREDICTED: calsenilin-like [Nicrophorus vespilloides]|uniref:Calsenilin-like n=1 Tax=Nicrophorus vespilloides TaxID=110193 RepID=A0ABM1NI41_NICVS|nr:PREDICTED: calsenilin-like [Nicrophorus vespilloides]
MANNEARYIQAHNPYITNHSVTIPALYFNLLFFVADSSLYAHYVFKAFDVNCNGAISFRDLLVTLSTLLRGSVYERLRWTFKLYDVNGDGCISRGELAEVVGAVHELMGRRAHQVEDDRKAREQIDRVFRKLDLNQDGVITIEEFMESCLKDDVITRSLQMFDAVV